MRTMKFVAAAAAILIAGAGAGTAMAQSGGDANVTAASPSSPFSQNKQNEPAVAIDANHPNVVVAGANEEIDMEACAAGDPATCPFTPGVGVSGVYFSFNGGHTWTQPTYQGWTARDCLGPAPCQPHAGDIGTLPKYFEHGLVSDGDPGLAFGPRPGPGGFSWANGERLYYSNLVSNFPAAKRSEAFRGAEAIGISRTDDPVTAAKGGAAGAAAWMDPVLISKQSATTFSDKEQIWADNAASSPFFGSVYVCWASFLSNSHGLALPTPLIVARSRDGGGTWVQQQVGPATDNGINTQPDGCTVRTDSHGNVYVFGVGARLGVSYEMMYKSTDGGAHFTGPKLLAKTVHPGIFDLVIGRPDMDGIAGARNDLSNGPSVDIANGAPTGAGASNEIVVTWADGAMGLNHEQLLLMHSSNGGASFSAPAAVPLKAGDRPYYTAPAISPSGGDLYIVYNAFTTPYRRDTTSPRELVGVVLHADVAGGQPGAFGELHRSTPGDPRASSQNNLVAEFLGDYVYAAATGTGAVAVWNDVRNGADCPAIDAWRASLEAGTPIPRPAPESACPAAFGNTDIFGAAVSDPTP